MVKILEFLGSNPIILGISTLCGIIGFILTIIVSMRTAKISKILKYNATTTQYNKERKAFQNTFEGHRSSITEDGLKTEKLLKDILKNVEEYSVKFDVILSTKDRITLWWFKRILKKQHDTVNWNTICNYLAILSGRLSKKEEKING